MSGGIEERINIYNQKKEIDRQNWKKIQALINFAKANVNAKIWEELECLIRFYLKGFLWDSQQALLDEMLVRLGIDYTHWAVKDGWVKMQIYNGFKGALGATQLEFLFLDLEKERIKDREKMGVSSKVERYKHLGSRITR